MHPRVLIVGTVPYNRKSTSRAFDAYFHYWEKENIAQIFSNTKIWEYKLSHIIFSLDLNTIITTTTNNDQKIVYECANKLSS